MTSKVLIMLEDNIRLRHFAKQMRRNPTPAELALWRAIRNRRLAGFKFRQQHPFGPYILDCYCPAARLVVELDGNTHATSEGQESDAEREKYLMIRGIATLRFWNTQVAENPDEVATKIAEVCQERVAARLKKTE
jgi:very-short-patch-repair endonuclease